jgi:hypothetical protein
VRRKDKVYLFHGLKDEVVNFGILDKIDHFYHYFTVDGEVNTGEGLFFYLAVSNRYRLSDWPVSTLGLATKTRTVQ